MYLSVALSGPLLDSHLPYQLVPAEHAADFRSTLDYVGPSSQQHAHQPLTLDNQ